MIIQSIVEQCSLDWLGGLGCEVLSGLTIAPSEPATERSDYRQVSLFGRLQTKLEDLNPRIPLEGLQEALRKIRLIIPHSSKTIALFIDCWLKAWTWSFATETDKSSTTRSG